ncbi:MAG: hypothetical protein GY845_02935 [Planctomycetes bacterium]|nr:hypothetical protein [Planctomycetota bacterium]
MKHPILAHYRHFSSLFTHFPGVYPRCEHTCFSVGGSTTVENIRQITPYLKKQTQFQKCQMMQAQYIQGIMRNIAASGHEKTNPIQTQFNPTCRCVALSEAGFKPNIEVQRKSRLFGNQSSLFTNHLDRSGQKNSLKRIITKKILYHIARQSLLAVT